VKQDERRFAPLVFVLGFSPCYNPIVNPDDVRFYRDRWKAVEEIERQELRASTPQSNWKQLNSIVRRSMRLGLKRGDNGEEMSVFLRWEIIRICETGISAPVTRCN
jgi:hypothetical protein